MVKPNNYDVVPIAIEEIEAILDNQPQNEILAGPDTRIRILGVLALLSTGTEPGAENIRSTSLNDHSRQLGALQRMDLIELAAGYRPRRHEWMHDIERNQHFIAFLWRMRELQSMEVRDIELEQATVEVASSLLMTPDENGNLFLQNIQVQSSEIYQLQRPTRDRQIQKPTEPTKRDGAVSFSIQWGSFVYGESIGFQGDNAKNWFVRGQTFLAPLDSITGFPDHWKDDGDLVGTEYKT